MTKKKPLSRKRISSLGGKARKAKLSGRRRSQIARAAANARWNQRHLTPLPSYIYVGPPVTTPTTGGTDV